MTSFYYLLTFTAVLIGAAWLVLAGVRLRRTGKAAKAARMAVLAEKVRLAHPVPLRTIERHNGAELTQDSEVV